MVFAPFIFRIFVLFSNNPFLCFLFWVDRRKLTNVDMKVVSVIIPMYNAERYLGETLSSVLASDYAALEVVCMDDGSSDGSYALAQEYAARDARLRVYRQANAGVCRARNEAIARAQGTYIFPVDADDTIEPDFISRAVACMEADSQLKVVVPEADFFGQRQGKWKLSSFSLHRLARKNTIPACALYRRSDWERAGGYCEEIRAREDWEFWIALLKDGGRVKQLPGIGFHYRIRQGGKRVGDRKLKEHVVKILNARHPEFFERELGGPLRINRSWSRFFNGCMRLVCPRRAVVTAEFGELHDFVRTLPYRFTHTQTGKVIYSGRNELREFSVGDYRVVVKSFCRPHLLNRFVYGWFRKSKAQRSCEYAALLRSLGIHSPAPVGWCAVRHGLLFSDSYYACLRSEMPYTYFDFMQQRIAEPADYLREIGRVAARMHEAGMIHRDFSRGNLLIGCDAQGRPQVEIIDLNRIRFRSVSLAEGMANFDRLPASAEMKRWMAEGYAEVRGVSVEQCLKLWPQGETYAPLNEE